MKFPANESNISAGDGTTTSTVLTSYILEQGLRYLEKGHHPVLLKEGLVKAGALVDQYLTSKSIPITSEKELYSICKIACNNDIHLSNIISEAVLSTGKDGAVLVEEGNSFDDRLIVKNS